jgi:carbon-monoxide dehydrogenase large subunit
MTRLVGVSVRRPEELPLLRGEATFVADISPPGAVHVAFVRSPYGHARLLRVDCSNARAHPGVIAALSAEDLDHIPGPIPVRLHPDPKLEPFLQSALATEKVRYVGEIVALVVADDRYVAEDAAELVEVDYEPLPAAVDAAQAARPDAPLLFERAGRNVTMDYAVAYGDIEAAFAGAELVVGDTFHTNRHSGCPIETRGLVATFEEGMLTVWGPTKVLHGNRRTLGELLGLPVERIRLVEPSVGGGFGVRGEVYPEDLLLPLLAMRLGRPVKWIEDRAEHLVAANHSREQHHVAELALDADGRFLGLRSRFLLDTGAYVRTHGIRVGEISAKSMVGPYRIAAYEGRVEQVVTNKTPAGTYRGPGRFETNFVRERLIDVAARRLGLDPAEIRRRNLVRASDMPYRPGPKDWGEPIVYESGDPPRILARTLEALGYEELRREQARSGRRIGIGIAAFMEDGGLGGLGTTPGEFGRVVIEPDGTATVYSGVADMGQGFKTMLAQVCAEELELEFEQVRVVHGDTDAVASGGGTWASRGAILAGNATLEAARAAKAKLAAGEALPVEASCTYTQPRMTYSPGAHAVALEVDPETGVVTLLRQAIGYEVGRAINPGIVEAQIQGGLAQGIGGAMLEHYAYDEDGQPLATSFMDYLLPSSLDMALSQTILVSEEAPSPSNALGVKAVGEVGPSSAGAAIGNAIADALADLDPRITTLPFSPERVFGWLHPELGEPEPL